MGFIHRPFTAVIVLATVCLLSLIQVAAQDNPDKIVLAEGTAISVVTTHDVTSKDAKPNDPVNFTVNEDLVVNGQVVVKKGTPAVGSVITELARMDNGRYFALRLKPGKHIVHMTNDKKGYAIDMGPDQTYYFRIGIEMGMWKGQGKITLDDSERAVQEIKKIKSIGQDKIKAPSIVVDIPVQ